MQERTLAVTVSQTDLGPALLEKLPLDFHSHHIIAGFKAARSTYAVLVAGTKRIRDSSRINSVISELEDA